jgi:HlyD family secretion protein
MRISSRASNAACALGILAAFAVSGCTKSTPPILGTVTRGDLIQRVTVAGTVIPRRRTVVMAPYNGYVKKMYVTVGDHVKADQPVVSVVQNLQETGEIYPLRAPFAGTVVQVLHTDGEYVEQTGDNNILIRIDDLGRLLILADVAEADMVKLHEGQDVVIKASAILSRAFKGTIREIFRAAREKKDWNRSSDKVEFPVRIEVSEQSEELKPGMSTLVDITAAKHEKVLLLRHEFVQKTGDQYFVVLADGTKRNISVGLQNEESFEITQGLSEGDKVRQTDFLSLAGD